jgi:exopolysaccharide biosynthesis protein
MPEQEAINLVRTENSEVGNKISSNMIAVNGENAYKDVIISNDIEESIKFEYIYFIKNGKTYLITFSARAKDFDKEKANFDMILKSFKIQ